MREVYLDHAATTLTRPQVIEAMMPYLETFYGNPSSTHRFGRHVRGALEKAREEVASLLHASPSEILYTSGGTEADNTAIVNAVSGYDGPCHVVTTAMEHHAVLHTCEFLEQMGVEVTYLQPDCNGFVTPQQVLDAIKDNTCIVSVMYVNNETGAIQPIAEIVQAVRERYGNKILIHTDAVQAAGILDIDTKKLGVDFLAISAHKFGGPKGIGALYVKKGTSFRPYIHGGSQERGRRAGTENTPGIIGMGVAARLAAQDLESKYQHVHKIKQHMLALLQNGISGLQVNSPENSVPTILNVVIPGMSAETLLIKLDMAGVAASSGSACTAGSVQPSHVLMSMGMDVERVKSSIRFSFSYTTTLDDVTYAAEQTIRIIQQSRRSEVYNWQMT
jgi:cysteine desulfurase